MPLGGILTAFAGGAAGESRRQAEEKISMLRAHSLEQLRARSGGQGESMSNLREASITRDQALEAGLEDRFPARLREAETEEDLQGADVVIVGAPYEGAAGVARTYSQNLLTPINLRKDSIKYGGYLPEFDIDVFEQLNIVDYGDASVPVRARPQEAIEAVSNKIYDVLQADAIPIVIGGIEVGASYPLIKELSKIDYLNNIGCITFDAHGDNLDSHKGELFSGATWLARMAELEGINMENHTHIGMRGPRNFKEQITWFREQGTRLITSHEFKEKGRNAIIEEISKTSILNTDGVFVSIDYDVLDIGCAPGLDEPMGLSVEDLLYLLKKIGEENGKALSLGWLPTSNKPLHWIAVWTILYFLAGICLKNN